MRLRLEAVIDDDVRREAGCMERECALTFTPDLLRQYELVQHGDNPEATQESPLELIWDAPHAIQQRYVTWARDVHQYEDGALR